MKTYRIDNRTSLPLSVTVKESEDMVTIVICRSDYAKVWSGTAIREQTKDLEVNLPTEKITVKDQEE